MAPRARSARTSEFSVQWVSVGDLDLDAKNPRLVEAVGTTSPTQDQLLKVLWHEMAVDELAMSIASHGYFEHEPIFADRTNGRLVVIEGNRRLAAVRLLRESAQRERLGATDIPVLTKARYASLDKLPVVVVDREKVWQYIGFKHVNGPQPWHAYAKAEYIAWVHDELGVPLSRISQQIGDPHDTVQRLYRGLTVLRQAEKAKVFRRADRYQKRFSFSHLYTGIGHTGIQRFLGITAKSLNTKAPVPRSRLKPLGELCTWLYGSKSRAIEPLVTTQNPHLRILSEILETKEGVVALRRGLPLAASKAIARGDERLFEESMQAAKSSLQQARGTLLHGWRGDAGLMETADEIQQLATDIASTMRIRERARKARQRIRRR